MVAVGEVTELSWLSSSGATVGFFILLLLLFIFLIALCNDCRRHSFELRDSEVDSNNPSLVRVIKLEETSGAQENPAINEIQSDEGQSAEPSHPGIHLQGSTENSVSFTPWRSHLGAPHHVLTNGGAAVKEPSQSAEENSNQFTPWRSHLGVLQSQEWNNSTPPDSTHIYHVIAEGRSSGTDTALPSLTNQEPGVDYSDHSEARVDANSMYAQVNKKAGLAMPLGKVQVDEEEEDEGEEESPPLPTRTLER